MAEVMASFLEDDGTFPNGSGCTLLVYRAAFPAEASDPDELAADIERTFARHGWTPGWRDGVYDFDHYHSTAHEVLGCFRGHARVRCGGPRGIALALTAGDVLVLPAGVGHKCLEASDDFAVVGAYAGGRQYDMICPNEDEPSAAERMQAERNIAAVPRPSADPVFGADGPLFQYWR